MHVSLCNSIEMCFINDTACSNQIKSNVVICSIMFLHVHVCVAASVHADKENRLVCIVFVCCQSNSHPSPPTQRLEHFSFSLSFTLMKERENLGWTLKTPPDFKCNGLTKKRIKVNNNMHIYLNPASCI